MSKRDNIMAFLGDGAAFVGALRFEGMVRIDCAFKGEITSDGVLVLGDKALVEGEIRVGELISSGKVQGDVRASRRVVLQRSADLKGNLNTPVLQVDEGAVFDGELSMNSRGVKSIVQESVNAA